MKEYNKEEITKMKEELCTLELEMLDDTDIFNLLMTGCPGWENIEDEEIIKLYITT